jgi:hypothetical protein
VFLLHNQQMHWSLRVNVGKCVGEIVFVGFLRRDCAGDNLAEETVHAVRILKSLLFSVVEGMEIATRNPGKAVLRLQFYEEPSYRPGKRAARDP